MDAFVGNWKAGPSDFENTEEFFKKVQDPETAKAYSKGIEVSIVKEGDNYIQTEKTGGVEIFKQIYCPGGVVKSLIPPEESGMKYRFEDGKLISEAEFLGTPFTVTQWIEDGKLVEDTRSQDSWMKTTLTKA